MLKHEVFQEIVGARRAVRKFDDSTVSAEAMARMLQAARFAPSSSNLQCWEVYWARDKERRSAFDDACLGQAAAATAAELVFFVSRPDLWQRNVKKLAAEFAGTPGAGYYADALPAAMAAYSEVDLSVWATKSCALAASQFMLAVSSEGLDSCPMEGLNPDKVRNLLSLPTEAGITMAVGLGKGVPEGLYGDRFRFPSDTQIFEV
jgi:nitroreductase